jgi:hypothetical protein
MTGYLGNTLVMTIHDRFLPEYKRYSFAKKLPSHSNLVPNQARYGTLRRRQALKSSTEVPLVCAIVIRYACGCAARSATCNDQPQAI